jgi:hypothetical protein
MAVQGTGDAWVSSSVENMGWMWFIFMLPSFGWQEVAGGGNSRIGITFYLSNRSGYACENGANALNKNETY